MPGGWFLPAAHYLGIFYDIVSESGGFKMFIFGIEKLISYIFFVFFNSWQEHDLKSVSCYAYRECYGACFR